jgi:hypothetical protein
MMDSAWKEGLAQCMHASVAAATLESMRLQEGDARDDAGVACKHGANLKRRPWQEKYMLRVSHCGIK